MMALPWSVPGGQQVQFSPHQIGGRTGMPVVVLNPGSLASEGYTPGSSGWIINGDGTVEFSNGIFRGTIEASEIHIGGFDATSFHVSAAGNLWLGAATFGAAPFSVTSAGFLTASNFGLSGGSIDGSDFDGAGTVVTGGQLASANFSAGSAGWRIMGNGDVEFNNGVFRGTLEAGQIHIGGYDATSFHVDAAGNTWWGGASWATARARVTNTGLFESRDASYTTIMQMNEGGLAFFSAPPDDTEVRLRFTTFGSLGFEFDTLAGDHEMSFGSGYPTGGPQLTLQGTVGGQLEWFRLDSAGVLTSHSGRVWVDDNGHIPTRAWGWIGLWGGGTSYWGIGGVGTASNNYLIIGNQTGNTYVSTPESTGSIFLRPGGNVTTGEVELNAGGRMAVKGAGIRTVPGNASAVPLAVRNNNTGVFSVSANSLDVAVNGVHQFAWTQSAGMYAPGMRVTTAGGQVVERFPSSGNELYAESSTGELKAQLTTARSLTAKLDLIEVAVWDAMSARLGADGRLTQVAMVDPARSGPRGQTWDVVGFHAEQLHTVWPEATIRTEDGTPVGVNQKTILAVLVQAVQELRAAAGLTRRG